MIQTESLVRVHDGEGEDQLLDLVQLLLPPDRVLVEVPSDGQVDEQVLRHDLGALPGSNLVKIFSINKKIFNKATVSVVTTSHLGLNMVLEAAWSRAVLDTRLSWDTWHSEDRASPRNPYVVRHSISDICLQHYKY